MRKIGHDKVDSGAHQSSLLPRPGGGRQRRQDAQCSGVAPRRRAQREGLCGVHLANCNPSGPGQGQGKSGVGEPRTTGQLTAHVY